MAVGSKKDRLKNKFSGIEMALKDQDIKYIITPKAIEASIPSKDNDSNLDEEIKTTVISNQTKDISYLDFVLKIGRIGFRVMSHVYEVLAIYIFRPLKKDSIRIFNFLKVQKASFKAKKNKEATSAIEAVKEVELQEIFLLEKPAEEVRATEEKVLEADTLKYQKFDLNTVETIAKVLGNTLSSFEIDVRQIFQGHNIEIKISDNSKEIDEASATLDFDSTLYEFLAFRLEQTKLNQNINGLLVDVVMSEKNITHTLSFDLKISGQKWSHMFSRNVLSMLDKRISPYQGSVECIHTFNATTKKELCSLVLVHQRLDAYTAKDQVESTEEISSPKKERKEVFM